MLTEATRQLKPQFPTLIELLRYRALKAGDRTAYTFLQDGITEVESLTYQQLEQRVRAIATQLQSLNAMGERVLLLYPQGLEFIAAFCGCLYAGAIAIPSPAPDATRLKRTLPRLAAIARDAEATIVLTTSQLMKQLEENGSHIQEFPVDQWLCTDQITEEVAPGWQPPEISSDTLAYLQYTSGSTSTPKGVMISHGNLMHHAASLQQACEYTSDSVTLTWMPYFHDYGLVQGLILPLYTETPCYLMSPFAFIRRPFHWLLAISRYGATHSQGPNFAYDYCLRRITPEQRAQLNLSSWQAAGIGAEPINPLVLQDFIATFAPCGFNAKTLAPAYGLAEATLVVSTSRMDSPPVFCILDAASLEQNRVVEVSDTKAMVRKIPGCGRLLDDTKVVIAHPEKLTTCAPNEVGEIWVSNPSVALGYWQRREDTEKTFRAQLQDTQEGSFLRTGDLGFIKDGELFVTGRIKDVMIILGRNYYPQDIEFTVERSHPAVRPSAGAAFSIEVNNQEQLVVVQEIERGQVKDLDTEQVIESIRQIIIQEHELPIYGVVLIKTGSIPKTSSGKIQRRACRSAYETGGLDVVAQWISSLVNPETSPDATGELLSNATPTQRKIAEIWADCLGLPHINLNSNFFILGGNSLHAAQIISAVDEVFSIELPPNQLLISPTVTSFAIQVETTVTLKQQQVQRQKPKAKSYQQFYGVVVSTVLVIILAIGLFNWVVDPYCLWNSPIIPGFNQSKTEQTDHEMLIKAIEITRLKPDRILLGTSRTHGGLDPRHPIFQGQNVYNLGLPSANIHLMKRFFDHALTNQPNLKQVIIGLDYSSFTANKNIDFDESRLNQQSITLKDLISVLFSTDALSDSLATVIKNYKNPQDIQYRYFQGFGFFDLEQKRPDFLPEPISIKDSFLTVFKYNADKYLLSNEQLDEFKSLVETCKSRSIDLKLFISPISATLWEAFRLIENSPEAEQERWFRSIVQIAQFWDFSDYNSVTTKAIPEYIKNYYSDIFHYPKEVGDLILNRIFHVHEETVPADFGVLVTPENIESHLLQIRADHQVWGEKYPKEAKLLQELKGDSFTQ